MLPPWRPPVASRLLIPGFLRLAFLRTRIRPRAVWVIRIFPILISVLTPWMPLRRRVESFFRRTIRRFPVSGSRADLQFIEFVPFSVGTITLRNGKKFANPATRIDGLRIIHADIMNHSVPVVQHS